MALFPLTGDLVIASHNPGKVTEIGALLEPLGVRAISASALNLGEPEETEDSFAGNALLKARAAALGAGLPALADDSGLSVAALDGAPGIYSARWAGPDKDFGHAMARVHQTLDDAPDRRAKFVCALAIARPIGEQGSGEEAVFEGEVFGEIVWPPRGERGFGYDPVFQPVGHAITFGEMDPAAKHGMSHRAEAFNRLLAAWQAATPG